MKSYRSAEEYISDVKKYIRWKRAREIATKELEYHIQDQYDALCADGCDPVEALQKSIMQMGDAEKIGRELDAVYRPKINVFLIQLTALFLILGISISWLTTGNLMLSSLSYVGIGICCSFVLYWCDYTILLRYPRLIFFSLVFLTGLSLIYEARNGFLLIGYSYTYYLLLLYPFTLVGIAFYTKHQQNEMGLLNFLMFALVPLIAALLISSLSAVMLLLISDAIIIGYTVRHKWYKLTLKLVISIACLFSVIGIVLIYIQNTQNIKIFTHIQNDQFIFDFIQNALRNSRFIGCSTNQEILDANDSLLSEYPLTLISVKYGTIVSIGLLLIFSFLLLLIYEVAIQQKTNIGRLTSYVILGILCVQMFGALLSNFGILNRYFMCLPFMVSGGLFTIYNMILIGIMLSVSRNEDIVRDWIKYKEECKKDG